MKNSIRDRNGITLIALVITVIVLILLSAVTISTLVGDNGLLKKGKNTANSIEDAHNSTEQARQELYNKIIAQKEGEENSGAFNVTLNVTADGLNLTISASVSGNNAEIKSYQFYIKKSIEDNSAYVKIRKDSDLASSVTTTIEEGSKYTIKAIVIDKNGNVAETKQTINTNIPKPTITNVSIGNVTYDSMKITVTASSDSEYPIIKYEYSLDGGNNFVSSASSSYTFSELSFGTTYNIVVKVSNSENETLATISQTTAIPEASSFDYTGNYQTYTVPATGKYKLQVWGAQGGEKNTTYALGGKGGYSVGTITLTKGDTLYIYVGGAGTTATGTTESEGGYNGGGNGGAGSSGQGASGGGATDIRIGGTTYYNRVIVAGGGGGSGGRAGASYQSTGGAGGGSSGVDGTSSEATTYPGAGASQTTGGAAATFSGTAVTGTQTAGSFGTGGIGGALTNGNYGAGGGGRRMVWRRPEAHIVLEAEAGGSGFVWTSSTAANVPSGYLVSTVYYLIDASTIDGNTSFESTSGGAETGHSGNGYAKITPIV